jgi:hypothetical protein
LANNFYACSYAHGNESIDVAVSCLKSPSIIANTTAVSASTTATSNVNTAGTILVAEPLPAGALAAGTYKGAIETVLVRQLYTGIVVGGGAGSAQYNAVCPGGYTVTGGGQYMTGGNAWEYPLAIETMGTDTYGSLFLCQKAANENGNSNCAFNVYVYARCIKSNLGAAENPNIIQ